MYTCMYQFSPHTEWFYHTIIIMYSIWFYFLGQFSAGDIAGIVIGSTIFFFLVILVIVAVLCGYIIILRRKKEIMSGTVHICPNTALCVTCTMYADQLIALFITYPLAHARGYIMVVVLCVSECACLFPCYIAAT